MDLFTQVFRANGYLSKAGGVVLLVTLLISPLALAAGYVAADRRLENGIQVRHGGDP